MTATEHTSPARKSRRQRKAALKQKSGLGSRALSPKDVKSMVSGLPHHEALTFLDHHIKTIAAARADLLQPELEAAIEHVGPSASVAAGKAAAQQLLDRLNRHSETQLLTSADMAVYAHRHRNWPAEAARRRNLIGLEHAGRTLYPAFQIDPVTRKVRQWVPTMVKALGEIGIDGRAFAVWAATASESFGGELPAERAGDEDFLSRAARELAQA